MIVTIDGPAGSGKSTTARRCAERLDYVYLDTGAMYRAVALGFLRADVDPTQDDPDRVLSSLSVGVEYQEENMHVFLGAEDVTTQIRTSEVGTVASEISSFPAVRERMVEDQRRIGFQKEETFGGVILDGRDTGTVVFPEADVKIFLVADVEERARRRQQDYAEEGKDVPFEQVRQEIEARDRRDRTRDIAPLRRADDALTLDTTNRSIDEQVAFVVDRVKEVRASGTSTEGPQ
ncbi:MAG: (d)CMP kinase [Salinibacter sp.]